MDKVIARVATATGVPSAALAAARPKPALQPEPDVTDKALLLLWKKSPETFTNV